MSKRGQDSNSRNGSPKRPTNQAGDARSVQRECLVTRTGISSQSGERISLAVGNCGSSRSNAEVGSSQMYRQEMVNLASGNLGQKDLTRPKSEEDDTNTGPRVAVSPEVENMRFSSYPYVKKENRSVKKKLGRTSRILRSLWSSTRTTHLHGDYS